MERLKVLCVSSEVAPFVTGPRVGGLGEVAGMLAGALSRSGVDIRTVTPKYRGVKVEAGRAGLSGGSPVWFVENDDFFNRKELYGDSFGDYSDNLDRFSFFCKQALERCIKEDFRPDIVHCHGWQAALVPVYLNTLYKYDPFFSGTKTLLTIHNIAHQGIFAKEEFPKMGLDWALYHIHYFEFYGKINLMKAGLVYSDAISTVSPTYAKEIQTMEYGCGLEGVLKERQSVLSGVLNGIDYGVWNPATDENIFKNYSTDTPDDKYLNKENLQRELGLKVDFNMPMIGMISRLADQKGMDLLARVIGDLLSLKVQVVILGTGDHRYHVLLEKMAKAHPKNTSINLRFDPELASKIYAASDIFIMPSRYEPCGMSQMISFKYGSIPVVRSTGGLSDSVQEYDAKTRQGTGFMFNDYRPEAFLSAIKRALTTYQRREPWRMLVKKDMGLDFSWSVAARAYKTLYESMRQKG